MDFLDRARNALERDDPARALVLLVQGLRRTPERADALDLFLHIYTTHISRPGLESDLFRALEHQERRSELLRLAIDEVRVLDKEQMALAIEEMARERGIAVAPAPSPDMPVGQEEMPDSTPDSLPDGESKESEPVEASKPVVEKTAIAEKSPASLDEKRTTSAPSTASAPVEPGPPRIESTSSQKKRAGSIRQKQKAMLFGAMAAFLFLALSAAYFGWKHVQEQGRVGQLEAAMNSFDPLSPEDVHRSLDRLVVGGPGVDAAILERRQFINALLALEGRDAAGLVTIDDPQTPWGLAAAALDAARLEEWEEAMRFAHYLEQVYPGSLPANFSHGRICETRQDWECALSRYERIQEHYPRFIAAYSGAIRVSAMRYDRPAFHGQQQRLGQVRPDHPYVRLVWIDAFNPAGQVDLAMPPFPPGDHFLQSWDLLKRAMGDLNRQEFGEAEERCTQVLSELKWRLPTAEILCAQAIAGGFDARKTRDHLHGAVRRTDLESVFYREVQVLGPRLLTEIGRADLALSLTIPFDDRLVDDGSDRATFVSNREQSRPAHFRRPEEPIDDYTARALLQRARTLLALGASQQAQRTLAPLLGLEQFGDLARLELVEAALIEGNRSMAQRTLQQIRDESLKQIAFARFAQMEGRHNEALELLRDGPDSVMAVRIRALAFLADGRGREALATLAQAPQDLDHLGLHPVRERVLARAGQPANGDAPFLDQDVDELQSLGHLIDMAAAAFWRRDLARCKALLERVQAIAPRHPEANWKMGLLRRVEGDNAAARGHFQRAWRGDEDSSELLIELGRVHLEYERFDMAREVFLRATLRDRRNLEAIEGLGLSYLHGDRLRGERDLAEVLSMYPATDRNAAARAELNRWLAIIHGSREGKDGSHRYLVRAREIIGERPEILIEEARYFQVREEFDEARQLYARALQRNPTLPETHLGLAEVSHAMGDSGAAREHLERLLGLVSAGDAFEQAQKLLKDLSEEEQ